MIGASVQASAIDNTPLPFQHFLPLVSSIVGFLMVALVKGQLFDPKPVPFTDPSQPRCKATWHNAGTVCDVN